MIKIKDRHIFNIEIHYWDVNNLYGQTMLQKLPVKNFDWIKDTLNLMKIS